jgi:amino-acid N-acetyltransferase
VTPPVLRAARPEDLPLISGLLEESALSPDGVTEFLEHFRVACTGERLVGIVGIEPYGREGLLRSLAVSSSQRSTGVGTLLLGDAVGHARLIGIRRLVLLTTTAAGYFTRHGWRTIDRSSVTGGVISSSQFRGACPSTATCMEMLL